jgi:hypothetical protein
MSEQHARTPRFNETPRYKAAMVAHDTAKKALRAARLTGEPGAIECAETAWRQASAALEKINLERFETIAQKRSRTAITAIDDLTKMATDRNCPMTSRHAAAIVDTLQGAMDDMKTTFAASLARPGLRRPVQFSDPVPAASVMNFDEQASRAN